MIRTKRSRLWPPAGSLALLLLLGFSPWGLWERDEGRYADVAREMLARRDFITPRIDGAVFLDKPPLVYWITATSMAVWGLDETGARCGQILFAAGILLVTRRIGILLFERRRANLALLVLASSLGFFIASHVLTLDLGLAFFVCLTLLFYLKGHRGGTGGRRAYLGMFAAAAGGVLVKGPIGAVLPALTIGSFLTLRQEWRRARELPWVPGVLLFVAIVIPWFAAVSIANPGFLSYFLVHEHLQRFATPVHRHQGAWYYYLAIAAAGLLPWTLYLPLHLMRRGARPPGGAWGTLKQEAPAFLWSWAIPGLLFFSAAQSKLPLYILPLFPAAALLVATALDGERGAASSRAVFFWPSLLLVVIAVSAAALRHRHASWEILVVGGLAAPLCIVVTGLALGGLLLGSRLARAGRQLAGLGVLALLWMIACETALTVVGRVNYLNETKHFAEIARREMRPGETIYAYQTYLRGLPFYLRRTVGLISPHSDDLRFGRLYGHDPDTFPDEASFLGEVSGDRRTFVVVRRDDLQALQKLAARPLYILARSQSNDLVSNRLGAERSRDLAALLNRTGFDLDAALASAARSVPGATLEMIEIERVGGAPTCTVRASRGGSHFEIGIPMDRPGPIAVSEDNPADEESGREDHLLRLAPPPEDADLVPRLIRDAAGG
ncbi:MAG TPA: glycosyltransferase family 39 protein [Candidatus Dormibacteraeota bacterium]|nr:glycosyltransferase family 39 protein [Candidatus Dormibacteraeota bacterium]